LSTIVTLEDKTNGLLKRRELKCLFKGFAGKLTRKEAAEMLAKELKLDKKFVIPISLEGETGMSDINCTFYVYDDENLAKRHLPKYIFMRMLTKEERKKAKEAEKAKGKKSAEGAPAEVKEAPKEEAKAETKAKEEPEGTAKAEKPKKEAKGKDKPEGETK
jgi:small subunit ribosomal protein S24e